LLKGNSYGDAETGGEFGFVEFRANNDCWKQAIVARCPAIDKQFSARSVSHLNIGQWGYNGF